MFKSTKSIFCFILLFASVSMVPAEVNLADMKSIMVGPRLGLLPYSGLKFAGLEDITSTPPLGVNVEIPLCKVLKYDLDYIKALTFGVQLLYYSFSEPGTLYDDMGFPTERTTFKFKYTSIDLTGCYYIDFGKKTFKPFCKVNVGYLKYDTNYKMPEGYMDTSNTYTAPSAFEFGVTIGVKWFVIPKLAVSAELGYGISLFQFGVDYVI